MTLGWKVFVTFVVSGLLAYCVGYSVGIEEKSEPPVVIMCPIDTVHVAKIENVWTCVQEKEMHDE